MTLKDKLVDMVAASLGIDSMDIELESHFINDIPDDQAEKLLTVGDVYSYLDNVVDDRYIR